MTHGFLDGLQHPVKAVRHLRAALVADGVLPARDERLAEPERWLPRAVARIEDPSERQVVRGFATWHHFRRLRRDAEKRAVTLHQAVVVRREVKAAIQLIEWLRARSTSLATCTQHDIDDWLATDIWVRYLARTFLVWSIRNRHAHRILIPIPPKDAPMVLIEQDRRWAHVRRLVKGDGVDTATRVAGLLLLLFAQPLSRTCQIRLDQVTRTQAGVRSSSDPTRPTCRPRWTPSCWSSSSSATATPPSDAVTITHGSCPQHHTHGALRRTPRRRPQPPVGTPHQPRRKWTKEAGSARADYAAELSRRKGFRRAR